MTEDILLKHPDKIPIHIISSDVHFNKNKFLVPKDFRVRDFILALRTKSHLLPRQSIFLLNKNKMVPMDISILDYYNIEKDIDNLLRLNVKLENFFG